MADNGDEELDWVEMGSLLRWLQDNDPDGFVNAAQHMGLSLRKAYYLAAIDRSLHGLPIPKDRRLRIGWTKLMVVRDHVTCANHGELLALCEAFPVHELRAILAGTYQEGQKHCVLLYLTQSQYWVFGAVIALHGAIPTARGFHGKEEALVRALTRLLPRD